MTGSETVANEPRTVAHESRQGLHAVIHINQNDQRI